MSVWLEDRLAQQAAHAILEQYEWRAIRWMCRSVLCVWCVWVWCEYEWSASKIIIIHFKFWIQTLNVKTIKKMLLGC